MKNLKKLLVIAALFLICQLGVLSVVEGQNIGINEPNPDNSALMEMTSTERGLLIPRMTTVERDAIINPANSVLIYNTTTKCFEFYYDGSWYSLGCTCTLPAITVATADTGATSTQITANWNTTNGATNYYIDVSTVSDFSSFVSGYDNLNVGNVTTYDITGLTCDSTYYYRIRAENNCGTSGNSNIITANTSACIVICAQLQRVFGGTINDVPYSISQTTDGGYIMGGYTSSFGVSSNNFYLLKTDENGIFSWSKTFGSTYSQIAYSMQQTDDGGYILAGEGFSSLPGNYDILVIKTNSSGTILWKKLYGGTAGVDHANSIQQTSDGGYIILGYTTTYGAGNYDYYLVKIDGSGNLSWSKTYGGTGWEFANSVQQTNDGGYIIAGRSTTYGAGSNDVLLIKTDGSGNISWSKTYGGTGSDIASFVQQTSDGGYIVAGTTETYGAGGNGDIYLIKTDSNGTLSWTKTYGGTGSDQMYDSGSIRQTTDGGYILVGRTDSYGAGNYDVFLIKTDVSGTLSWAKTYGGTAWDEGNSVQQTSDGGYIIGASTESFGAGFKDVFLIKTDANGNAAGCNTTSPTPIVGSGGSVSSPSPTVTSPASGTSTPSPSTTSPSPTVGTQCSNC